MKTREVLRHILCEIGKFIVGMSILALLAYWYLFFAPYRMRNFDAAVWHAHPIGSTPLSCDRGGMANDVQQKLLNKDMTRDEVLSLLGDPDQMPADQQLEYHLGACDGFHVDGNSLIIQISAQGRYEDSYIVQH